MTQPPNQPPQGGFGAPQNPPQQPPQSGPYAQPGPYGQQPGPYHTPQPGPYAPQSGPYATPVPQPGYGYPQQQQPQPPQFPGAPTPPPGGGSKNPFKGRPVLVVAAAAAALAVIGGTVYAVSSGDDEDKKPPVAEKSKDPQPTATSSVPVNPGDGGGDGRKETRDLNEGRKPGEDKVLWFKQAPAAPGSGADAPGMWITGKTAVKAAYKQVFAYDVDGGAPTWEPISLPQKICAVTAQKTDDDKVVVAYMSGISDRAKCNQLQEIDLDTGKKGWSMKVDDGDLFDDTLNLGLTLTGKTLVVARAQSGIAFDVDSGKKLWEKSTYGASCYPKSFAGGSRLISVSSCAVTTAKEHDELQELDPATGRAKWTKKIPKGWKVAHTYSLNPLVLHLTNEDENKWNISAFKNNSPTVRSQLDVKESFAPECDWALSDSDLQGCTGVVADVNTVYLPTEAKKGPNEVVAVSLESGKERWRVKSPGDAAMLPLKMDGTRLIAYVGASSGTGGQVVSIETNGSNHSPTTVLRNPSSAAAIERGFYDKAIDYVDGRFYISATHLSGSGEESKEKLMLAYGK
ncbi:PQQ-binding-like beta-propeller repeat protein [Streptomyces sp. NPDC052051]|uniref:outer membrane protein assembly factor BamB family protein n=1 Tax=Streptomyces sp. NPDC052051 TaxID=3154649 RepID=UPI00342458D3